MLPPGAGEPIRPPCPLLLQDPMTQRWNWVEGDWDGSVLTGPVPGHPQSFKPPPCFPPYPSFATPLCIIYGQEKGTETRKEGSRKGGAVHPLTQPKPRGHGSRARFWS